MSSIWLPLDIYVHILKQLPADSPGDSFSLQTLLSCCQTNSLLRAAAVLSSVWEPHYRARYTVAVPEREAERREIHGDDWRLLFYDRRRLDREALTLLTDIIERTKSRHSWTKDICRLSFDIWNILEYEIRNSLPEIFREPGDHSVVTLAPHALTRRFWAQNILGVIARHDTLCLWGKLTIRNPDAITFEEALAGLSAFFDHPSREIIAQLDVIAARCREHLLATGHSLSIDKMDGDGLAEICTGICAFLRSQGFDSTTSENFHDAFNHFPHRFLSTHKKTIPLSLVYVFTAVARRLGIAASPTNFPRRLIAHVSSPNPDVPDIYVDVFGSSTEAILTDIPRLVMSAGINPAAMMDYIAPSTADSMLLRASRNITAALQVDPYQLAERDCAATIYAVFCANLHVAGVQPSELKFLSNFPLDLRLLRDTFAPLLPSRIKLRLESICDSALTAEKEAAKVVYQRSGISRKIAYFVGLIFKHIRHDYVGCITGWDPVCMASEDWIFRMEVDFLTRGRKQPYYHVSAMAGPSAVRYVAEENIRPIPPTTEMVQQLIETVPELGRYFEGIEINEDGWGRMLLSPESWSSYPDDDGVGSEWLLAKAKG